MFHNYFFLKRLAESLKHELVELKLLQSFSQNKDELILGFASKDKERFIKASLDPEVCLLQFPGEFKKANKNYVDLYEDLMGLKVIDVQVYTFERSFRIELEDENEIIFKMHASRSNILIAKAGKIKYVFKSHLKNDYQINPSDLAKDISLSQENFNDCEGNLRKFLPALGKEVNQYLQEKGYMELPLSSQWSLFQEIRHQLEHNPIWIYQAPVILSLLKSDQEVLLETSDPILAANELFRNYTYRHFLEKGKSAAFKTIDKSIKQNINYLSKTRKKLEEIQTRRNYEEIANLIMANLYNIPKGSTTVTLQDFYQNKDIEIKLKQSLSPQKNAEQYYRKSKNQKKEIEQLTNSIKSKEWELQKLEKKRAEIEDTQELKYIKKHVNTQSNSQQEKPEPFIRHEFQGYQILIGKNAKQNDELTLKHATKNDLWLHAKDVSGSHVVIKTHPGQNYPGPVIERAAELAAWYSKRKTDSLCPVIYTPKKYIRKRKGDPAGAVIVEKEDVIMVEPRGV